MTEAQAQHIIERVQRLQNWCLWLKLFALPAFALPIFLPLLWADQFPPYCNPFPFFAIIGTGMLIAVMILHYYCWKKMVTLLEETE